MLVYFAAETHFLTFFRFAKVGANELENATAETELFLSEFFPPMKSQIANRKSRGSREYSRDSFFADRQHFPRWGFLH